MKSPLKIFICLLLLLPAPSFGRSLKLEDVRQVFLAYNPALKGKRSELAAAEHLENEAGRRLFPSLTFTGALTEQKTPPALTGGFDVSPPKIYSTTIDYEQPIFLGGQIWRSWELRELEVAQKKLDLQQFQQELLSMVLKRALNTHINLQLAKVLTETVSTQQQFLKIIRRKEKRGAAKAFEVYQAESDLLGFQSQLLQLQQGQNELTSATKADLGIAEDEDLIVLVSGEEFKSVNGNVSLEQAYRQRPEVNSILVARQMAIVKKWLDLGEHLPSLVLKGQAGYQALDKDTLFEEESDMYKVTLALQIPIFSGLSSVAVRRSNEQKIASVDYRAKDLANMLKGQYAGAKKRLQNSEKKYALASDWTAKAEKALNLGVKNYRLGIISSFQVVQLQRGREAAARGYWQSLQDLIEARIDWAVLTGQPLASL